jgi:2-(1,2-epoxy-1,2-dihydrophenyl)acetyl-CoA isomerase
MQDFVIIEREEAVSRLTLNRPQRHNSLIPALLTELLGALKEIQHNPEIRAVVLQANGRSFSTGGDLLGFYDHLDSIQSYANQIVGLLNQVILTMVDLRLPIVAAVHGQVTGGSMGLVLASDLVLIAPTASFTPYYSEVGFSPDGGWTAWLPEIIGVKRTIQILMLNETINADQALSWGLAHRLVPADQIQAEALKTAHQVAAKPPGSIQPTKRLLHPVDLANHLEAERRHFTAQIGKNETQKCMKAFLDKMGL